MSFRLQAAESAPDGIRRIAIEQIDGAIHELGDRRRNPHNAIHSARQRCKRVRAVLRLVRSDLGGAYDAENKRFRDIARSLSDVRDAEAVLEAIDKLSAACEGQREKALLRSARRSLRARHREVTAEQTGLAAHMEEATEGFREANEQVAAWALSTQGFDLLGRGIRKTYANSRKAFATAYRKPSDAQFHETRKRVKYHWYQMRVLQNIWPNVLRSYRSEVKTLSDLLGDDHDLTVMRAILLERPASLSHARKLEGVLGLIEHRRARLKADAQALGRRLFAERPQCFTDRLGEYWCAWQEDTERRGVVEEPTAQAVERAVA